MNTPVLLIADEKKDPGQVIVQFCKTFRPSYVQMEQLDMLDAVIPYKGDKEIYKGPLVLFYEALFVLVTLAYRMCRHENGVKSALVRGRPVTDNAQLSFVNEAYLRIICEIKISYIY